MTTWRSSHCGEILGYTGAFHSQCDTAAASAGNQTSDLVLSSQTCVSARGDSQGYRINLEKSESVQLLFIRCSQLLLHTLTPPPASTGHLVSLRSRERVAKLTKWRKRSLLAPPPVSGRPLSSKESLSPFLPADWISRRGGALTFRSLRRRPATLAKN